MRRTTDPLSEMIEAAVERVLERRIPDLIRANLPEPAPAPVARPAPQLAGERFVTLKEAGQRLGVHRTTLLRWEHLGLVPIRRRMPGNKTGWLQSEVEAFLANLGHTAGTPARVTN